MTSTVHGPGHVWEPDPNAAYRGEFEICARCGRARWRRTRDGAWRYSNLDGHDRQSWRSLATHVPPACEP